MIGGYFILKTSPNNTVDTKWHKFLFWN